MEDNSSDPSLKSFEEKAHFWRSKADSINSKQNRTWDKEPKTDTKNQSEQCKIQDQEFEEHETDPNDETRWPVRFLVSEQSETQDQESEEPKTDSVQLTKENSLVATATKDQTEESETQDQQSKEPKTDSVQATKENSLVATATKDQTEQSETQDQQSKEPKTDSVQLIEELPAEAAPEKHYNDILVLGRTGMGKSSTVDKLVAATSKNQTEQSEAQDQESKELNNTDSNKNTQWLQYEFQYENLRATVISEPRWEAEEKKNTEKRLENIVHSRKSKEKAHIKINKLRAQNEGDKSSSKSYQLLENCETKIRVLDPPGFYGHELSEGSTSTWNSNFKIVRQIVRFQAIKGLNFCRILYFLPQNGPLKRSDQALQEEIQKLAKYFGRSIFKHLVLIGTMPQHISENPELTLERKFPQDLLEQSRVCFHETLVREFEQRKEDTTEIPSPPIIFIAMTDTCEEILEKVMNAPVDTDDTLQLRFNSNTCSKCGIETGINSDNVMVCEYREPGQIPWAKAAASEETHCHPDIIPMKTFKSVTLGLFKLICICRWQFTEDLCINCNKRAGSPGCWQVNTPFDHQDTEITVLHSSRLNDRHILSDSSVYIISYYNLIGKLLLYQKLCLHAKSWQLLLYFNW